MTALRREPLIWIAVAAVVAISVTIYFVERPEHINALSVLLILETTVTIVGAIFAIFVNAAWHWPAFRGWFVRVPDLRGTWSGALTPLDSDGNHLDTISCTLTIRQKLFSVKCSLKTNKAESHSISGTAYLDEDTDEAKLIYVYRGTPQLADLRTNPGHNGTGLLSISGATSLSGSYFTERCTRGLMSFQKVD